MFTIPQDKGARFRKCDFQIHSLRDANWTGPFADAVNERKDFAEALVADSRRKGIHAIAITDHHDLCVWKIVQDAAHSEKRLDGTAYPPNEQLVVFPGVELTLATPSCQALLLFDPDLTEPILNHIWGALRVIPTASTSAKTTQTQPLHTDLTLNAITNALNSIRTNPEETTPAKFRSLEGRFILLPNVKKGGHKTIVRVVFILTSFRCRASEDTSRGASTPTSMQVARQKSKEKFRNGETEHWVFFKHPTVGLLRQGR